MMAVMVVIVAPLMVIVAPLRKGLDAAGCVPHCATCGLALTSNQPHRFTPNPLDYTDGGDLGASSSLSSKLKISRHIKHVQEYEGYEVHAVALTCHFYPSATILPTYNILHANV